MRSERRGPHAGIRYVRHKPGKSVFVLLDVVRSGANDAAGVETFGLTMDETVAGPLGDSLPDLLADLERAGSGSAASVRDGVTIRRLPDDPGLPALRAIWSPRPGDALSTSLEAMLTEAIGAPAHIVSITALPRHYKPGSRCVIEYRLSLAVDGAPGLLSRSVFVKVFAKPGKALEDDVALRRLRVTWETEGALRAWTPRSLGVHEALGLLVTDSAVGDGVTATSGDALLQPPRIARTALDMAASALARLHTTELDGQGLPSRDLRVEIGKVEQYAGLLCEHTPSAASRIVRVTGRVVSALDTLEHVAPRVCHGSFKRSQLVYTSDGRLTAFDWDSMCVADPAGDLGCFLAHLRPSSLWYGHRAANAWFAEASSHWLASYVVAAERRGALDARSAVERSGAYEAAWLIKMATRRLRRRNSPRLGELTAMLDEAESCLDAAHGADISRARRVA